ncbi:MAG: PIN domain-containing protein [Nitrososphaeria archaeon]|jgi:predicted nucleic acid-binding protein
MGDLKWLKIALDTNILIYLLEGIEPYASKVENLLSSFMKGENHGIISTINVAEILNGFYRAKEEKKAARAKTLLQDLAINDFEIVPVTFEIADLAARLRVKRGGKLPEALIVATAINQAASLIYSQDEDLQRFSEDIKVSKIE